MKTLLLIAMMSISIISCSQEKVVSNAETQKESKPSDESKLEQFTAKSGVILRFIDYHLPDPKLRYRSATASVRAVYSGDEIGYFLIVESKEEYRTSRAAIAHEDLLEVIKALTVIKEQAQKDIALAPDYLENRFVSEDGFTVGYYVNKSELVWFMRLEQVSGSAIFPRDVTVIDSLFGQANDKINKLKNEEI